MAETDWNTRPVDLGGVVYPYHYGVDCLDRIVDELGAMGADRFFVVTDDHVLALHGERLLSGLGAHAPVEVLSLPPGDGMKALPNLAAHVEHVIAAGASRRSVVVAFGGGVPGNLAGVVASLLFRGVRLVHVPTTTVAAMDSVISLKQAINSSRGKNHIGTYRAPEAVYLDVRLLATLPDKQLRSGLCEATKNCLAIRPDSIPEMRRRLAAGNLAAPETLVWLLEESLTAKTAVTRRDPYEQGSGLVLEYGHTVGHAVEMCDQRLRGAEGLSHGEAVMLGMLAAARISRTRGGLDDASVTVHEELAQALGAPTRVPERISVEQVMDVVRVDNKRGYLPVSGEEAAMVLLREHGVPYGTADLPLTAVPLEIVKEAVTDLMPGGAR
ncbi:2-deoxy-scyllo-inosose synthase [Streptomyces sp. NPDC006464]|uniref:2-deoxy-scyllo-inosose synthase n=1 Tax=Streptomyces sp. NPDC006464 TaxID=3154305 RepID=UPI0033A88764